MAGLVNAGGDLRIWGRRLFPVELRIEEPGSPQSRPMRLGPTAAATSSIRKEVKRRKKEDPGGSGKELAWECARMALKVERYRQIAVDKIYDFANKKN